MYRQLEQKARANRRLALLQTRMPQHNVFWDGTMKDAPCHSVSAQLTDVRIRMAPPREALAAPTFVDA